MIPFPDISPDIFSISLGSLKLVLRWYAVSYIAGFICALLIMKFYIRRSHYWVRKEPPMGIDQADTLLTYLILGVIIGGRIGYVLFYNLAFYLDNPIHILRVWDGGMSFHGGFIGVIFAVIYFAKLNDVNLISLADLVAIASPPGLLFGRVANFINAELWGRPTDMPWGVIFPGVRAQDCPGFSFPCARHPSQLYEAGLEGLALLLLMVIFAYFGAFKLRGFLTGIFFLGYGLARFYVEFFRVPDPQFFSETNPFGFALSVGDFGVTMGQALTLPMIILGIMILTLSTLRKR